MAAATPREYGNPKVIDETLEPFNADSIKPGDVVGIGIHTANVYRGLQVGKMARERICLAKSSWKCAKDCVGIWQNNGYSLRWDAPM